ncbi:serine hydrolase [Variovorax sp. J22R133]|uniref:serine hydrolase domain-containing protein n=1 Tax=Variovorax brevis TaxID=3053503 RepID=UPI002574B285|nr:serine hydrolase [Variovorax sp. J22R133]MDM0115413.1 serine hydrolase [Variovorax sp. J22R133]
MLTGTPPRRTFIAGSVAAAAGLLLPSAASLASEIDAREWVTRPPADEGIDGVALQSILEDARSLGVIRSPLVVRHGALVAEAYYGGASAGDLQPVHSATKSVASMLVGMALAQGRIGSISQTVDQLLPTAVDKAPGSPAHAITLEQILTGTSGLRYDYSTQMAELEAAPDPVAYALGLPVDASHAARKTWVYNDAAVSLISPILVHAHGMSIEAIARRDLFGPLGIERYAGERDKAGHVMSYRGLRLRARDMARIAWTMANDGRWGDRQVVPVEWVSNSLRTHVPATWSAAPMTKTGYGYLWFTGTLGGHPVAWAWGYGAQFALVAPTLRLAVTTTARIPPPSGLVAQNNAVMSLVARIVALAK